MFSVSSIFSSPLCLRASCHHISFTELVQTWCHFFLRLKPWHFNNFQCIFYHLIDTPYLQYLRMMTQYFQKQKEKRGGIWRLLRMKPLLVRVVDILCHSDIDLFIICLWRTFLLSPDTLLRSICLLLSISFTLRFNNASQFYPSLRFHAPTTCLCLLCSLPKIHWLDTINEYRINCGPFGNHNEWFDKFEKAKFTFCLKCPNEPGYTEDWEKTIASLEKFQALISFTKKCRNWIDTATWSIKLGAPMFKKQVFHSL